MTGNLCLIGAKELATPTFVVWGDSHADAILPSLNSVAASYGLSGWVISRGGCVPLLGIGPRDSLNPCPELSDAAIEFIAKRKIKQVIVVAWWPVYCDNRLLVDSTKQPAEKEPAKTVFARAFDRTLSKLTQLGVAITVVAPVPGAKMNVPSALARSALFSKDIDIFQNKTDYSTQNQWLLNQFSSNSSRITRIIYPHQLLCNESELCKVAQNGIPLYFDTHHTTVVAPGFLTHCFTTCSNQWQSRITWARTLSPLIRTD